MKKSELTARTDRAYGETRDALQTVYDALNHGQRQKLLKNETVKAIFERYNVQEAEV